MNVNEIIVGDRIRKDLGSVEELAEDIKANGLINPITVNEQGRLLAGERRLRAMILLGWTDIPVTVMQTRDEEHELSIEASENESRKEFSRAERASYIKRMLEAEKAKAKERMSEGGKGCQNSDTLRADEVTAAQFGMSRDTVRKELAIAENQDLLDPEDFADWDEGRLSTNKAYQLLKQQLETAREETEDVKRLLHAERAEGIKSRKAAEEEAQELRKQNQALADENQKIQQEAEDAKDELDLAKALIRARNAEPDTVVERIVEKVPDDYEALKSIAARSEAEQVKLFEENQAKAKRIRELEEQLGQDRLLANADRDVQAFTVSTMDYIRRYGGHVWSFEQLSRLSEPVRLELVKAVRTLNSFTAALIQNMEGGNLG